MPFNKSISLKYVLHVLNLKCNLMSINKVTKDLNNVAKFFPYYCEFQDLISEKTISTAKEYDGLYYFDNIDQNVNIQVLVSSSGSVFVSKFNEIM